MLHFIPLCRAEFLILKVNITPYVKYALRREDLWWNGGILLCVLNLRNLVFGIECPALLPVRFTQLESPVTIG